MKRVHILRAATTALCATALVTLTPAAVLPWFNAASATPQYHTVTFAENDNSADSVYATQTEDAPTSLTLFADLSPAFADGGQSFLDWNTAPDGSGTSYFDGETYNFDSAIVLYAIWSSPYATVTFAENDSVGDEVAATETKDAATPLTTFADLSPSFANAGHSFLGWNTQPNGTGTTYTDGETYDFNAALELYAQWQPDQYLVTYSASPGTVSPGSADYTVGGSALILPTPSGAGASFEGWFTSESGGTLVGVGGSSYQPTQSLTLYAQWGQPSSNPPSPVQIAFALNGGDGSVASESGTAGSTVTLPNSSSATRPGFTLTSWNTAANGSGTSYALGSSVTLTSSLTLYAQWTANASSSSSTGPVVSFAANGGSGSLTTLSGAVGSTVTLPSSSSLLRSGYTLTSWNTAANGSGTSYAPGASVTLTASMTLYAQWSATPTAVLYGAIGEFARNSVALTAKLKKQVDRLAASIRSKHFTSVSLYGYTAETGLASLDRALSGARAKRVAAYLRRRLAAMDVKGVAISASGEGAVGKKTAALYSRVEVFVK